MQRLENMPVAYFQLQPQRLCREDPQEQNVINVLRTVAAFGKYAGGIFLAATAAAVPRGSAGTKRN